MIREGYEDLKRYQADLETNSKKTKRYSPERDDWETNVEWKDLKVGDIVRVEDEEYFAADLIVLTTSNNDGSSYIMTSSLDGEKNLKPKFTINKV